MSAVRAKIVPGDDREAAIRALLPMVRHLARRVHRMVSGSELDDLVGDGSVGLIRAVDAFDPGRGIPLEQYAKKVVLGAMLNGMRRLDPVSERVRRTIRIAERARYAQAHREGRMPTPGEMESVFPELARARAHVFRHTPLSLDTKFPGREKVGMDIDADPQIVLALRADRRRIHGAITALPPRQRRIVVAHYYREHSLRSLGPALGVSPQRVSQLHLLAIKRLRKDLLASA
jgi:RNA polymerase sigma factor FliA